jgi:heptaprenylglyceryl phosphate synthase
MRTFPYIFDQIKLKYPGVTIIPHTTFTMGTGINDDGVAQSVKNRKADACIVGNAG